MGVERTRARAGTEFEDGIRVYGRLVQVRVAECVLFAASRSLRSC